jgi:hypothetical protein
MSDITPDAEVMIHSGAHRFQHGRVISEDNSFSIPFSHVQLRGKGGRLMQSKFAFVPSKYLCHFDVAALRAQEQARVDAQYGADSKHAARIRKAIAKAVSP